MKNYKYRKETASGFPNRETASGVTSRSRRGRSCYLFLLRHFSRALDAATGEPDCKMIWRRE